jgi:hypothetical protein
MAGVLYIHKVYKELCTNLVSAENSYVSECAWIKTMKNESQAEQ